MFTLIFIFTDEMYVISWIGSNNKLQLFISNVYGIIKSTQIKVIKKVSENVFYNFSMLICISISYIYMFIINYVQAVFHMLNQCQQHNHSIMHVSEKIYLFLIIWF